MLVRSYLRSGMLLSLDMCRYGAWRPTGRGEPVFVLYTRFRIRMVAKKKLVATSEAGFISVESSTPEKPKGMFIPLVTILTDDNLLKFIQSSQYKSREPDLHTFSFCWETSTESLREE